MTRYLAVLFAILPVCFARAQTWTQTGADTNYAWGGISSSADGTKLVATVEGVGGGIYLSTNSGAAWFPSYTLPIPSRTVSSADGTRLAVEAWNFVQSIYTTTNSGAAWSLVGAPPMGGWGNGIRGINSSAAGNKLFVFYTDGTTNSGIYLSTNWGASWSQDASLDEPWASTTCTADGTRLAGITLTNAQVFVSTNTGATWQPAAPISGQSASCILSTADGCNLMADSSAGLFISTNWGVTWSCTNYATAGGIVCSADGSLLLGMNLVSGTMSSFQIYTSTNWGAIWTLNNLPATVWEWVACSADGKKLFVTGTNGIWTL